MLKYKLELVFQSNNKSALNMDVSFTHKDHL